MTTTPFDAVISALEARRSGNPNAIRDMALIDAVEAYTGRQHMSFSIAIAFAEGLEAGKRDAAQWQPIETAPRDGTKIDIWSKGYRIPDAYFVEAKTRTDACGIPVNESGWWAPNYDYDGMDGWACAEDEPTHWMPLPAAPDTEAG